MKQTNLFSYFLLMIAMFLCATNVYAQDKEPYAVLSEDRTVLTFYYNDQKEACNGMSVGPFTDSDVPSWIRANKITTAVFDSSFANCTSITSTAYWFYFCNKLTTIVGIENLKTDNVTDMSSMFYSCYSLTNLDLSSFNTANVTDMSSMFYSCYSLTNFDLSSFNTANVTDMSKMFFKCSSLTSLDLSRFNTGNVTNMGLMFEGCSGLTSLDVSHFNTANVTNMHAMFAGCESLTSLDLNDFNTDNVTDMGSMFSSCSGLTSLDVSRFNTANVTDMTQMFYGCSGLTSLDLSSFNTAYVTSMGYMFFKCSSLTTIYVSDLWRTNSVNRYYLMYMCYRDVFSFCTSLVGGQGTVYDSSRTDVNYAVIDGGPTYPGYFTYKEPTGIQSIKSENRNPSVVYNLSGIRSSAPQKGINIIGGKKVIVK